MVPGRDVLATFSNFHTSRKPQTVVDAAGQSTTLTYDGDGDIVTTTLDSKGETWTNSYYLDTAPVGSRRQIHTVSGPGGVLLQTFTYDSWGRTRHSADKVLGSFAIDDTTPVEVEFLEPEPDTCCVPFKWRTMMYVEDSPGANPGDRISTILDSAFRPGTASTLFPSRPVKRAEWEIKGSGKCCPD
jgi:YD repeat-containing protein